MEHRLFSQMTLMVAMCLTLADRLAVAEQIQPGQWRIFTGNEIGIILASFMLQRQRNLNGGSLPSNLGVLTTVVSSHMLQAMAQKEGIHFYETLTGFKWLGNKAIDLKRENIHVFFAYEEAIGYMVSDLIRDKDGITALAVFAEWSNFLYSQNQTLCSYLDTLYEKYGYWVSKNHYYICHDPILIKKIFDKIRYGSHQEVCQVTHLLI